MYTMRNSQPSSKNRYKLPEAPPRSQTDRQRHRSTLATSTARQYTRTAREKRGYTSRSNLCGGHCQSVIFSLTSAARWSSVQYVVHLTRGVHVRFCLSIPSSTNSEQLIRRLDTNRIGALGAHLCRCVYRLLLRLAQAQHCDRSSHAASAIDRPLLRVFDARTAFRHQGCRDGHGSRDAAAFEGV
jgi:hypothetical protein